MATNRTTGPGTIRDYIRSVESSLKTGSATEHTYRAALEKLLRSLQTSINVVNEPKRSECGAPDLAVLEKRSNVPIGHVEAKDIGVSLAETHKSEQLARYRKYLPNLILTDYVQFRHYVGGDLWSEASLGTVESASGKLRTNPAQQEAVEQLLSDFFAQQPQQISSPKDLAERLARLTHMTRDIIVEAYRKRKASPILKDLRDVLATLLIPELAKDEEIPQFADLYAQTLTYGLFAAVCNHYEHRSGEFSLRDATGEIPKTNPLLRQLFNSIAGPDFDDEPYAGFVHEIVAVLNHANIREILADFGESGGHTDPVLHFYETFLATYDPKLRESRGVYYTPEPVVQYIVRSIDELLKSRFNISDGLADTEKLPPRFHGQTKRDHRTLILDPATGTGTFLYEVIETIRERFRKQKRAGFWTEYVHDDLLPRLFGFELLMAPYAMAHLKLGMQLAGQDLPEEIRGLWKYGFETDDRLQVYLTNTLEQVERHTQNLLGSLQRAIGEESEQAALIKRDLPILVVLGNPPYSGVSSNQGEWIDGLLKGSIPNRDPETKRISDYTPTASYYHVDGKPLGERKVWLQDDYVKFIRWAQWRLEQTGHGILGFITNHGYLDNPTFRGMRWALIQAFDEIYLLDLHGNTKKKEVAPDGGPDNNVFDIQQGVSIGIFIKKHADKKKKSPAKVYHADLWGKREAKYNWLAENSVETTEWEQVEPDEPFYLFKPFDKSEVGDYYDWPAINDIMPVNVTGIVTARDHFVIDFDAEPLLQRITELRDTSIIDDAIRQKYFQGKGSKKYPPGDSRGWKLPEARSKVREDEDWDRRIAPVLYRPFDSREVYYVPWMVDWPRTEAMPHMLRTENKSIMLGRAGHVIGPGEWDIVFASALPTEFNAFRRGGNNLFPLYLYPNVGKVDQETFGQWSPGTDGRRPNLDSEFVQAIESATGMTFITDGHGDLASDFGPEDVLAYIYAVFHWPEYRRRYEPMLKLDFPRVPPPEDAERFITFAELGHQLLAAHLLEDESLTGNSISFPMPGENLVEKGYPKYVPPKAKPVKAGKAKLESDAEHGRVYISPHQYFEGIEPEVWEFQIGGYQVCEKWLKDRRGVDASHSNLSLYPRIIESLRKTIAMMVELDRVAS